MAISNSKRTGSRDPKPQNGAGPASSEKSQRRSPLSLVKSILKKLVRLVFVLIAFVAYCAVVPIFLAFMIPMYIYRGLIILLQKVLHPDWVGIMSSRDAIVGLDDTTKRCECMIFASIVFRGSPDLQRIYDHFQKNVLEEKNFKGELWYKKMFHYYENWMGFPFWKKEEDFKLEKHLRLFDYPVNLKKVIGKNGEMEEYVTEDELLRSFGEMEKLPFAKGQSPWEILVLPNFIPREGDLHKPYIIPELTVTALDEENGNVRGEDDPEKGKYFTLVYRVHHAIGDGYSWLKMLMCNICGEPIECVPKAPTRDYNFAVKILHSIAILIFTPYYHFKQFIVEIERSIWHLPSNKLSKRSHFVTTERIPLESLRQIGKAHKTPLTGVLLAGLSGGVHNFLKLTGKGHLIPKFMRALSPMPWQNHPAFSYDGLVNHWTAGVFGIPVGEDTPIKRLKACKKSMQNLVNSPILVSNFLTVPLLLSAPNFMTDFWGTNWMGSMILSNFPGPRSATKSFGKYPLDNILTYVPHMRGSAGLGVMFPTCLGNVRCTLSIDHSIIKDYSDAQLLVGLIDEEFRIIRTLLSSPRGDTLV